MSRRLAVVGSGYVGTVVAACFAHVGHRVVGIEADPEKLVQLSSGSAPFHEPGLDPLIAEGIEVGRLSFSGDLGNAMQDSEIVVVCVGTPLGGDGLPDMSAMEEVAVIVGDTLMRHQVIVTKSTVPVGTGRWMSSLIEERIAMRDEHQGIRSPATSKLPTSRQARTFSIVSNPEFLREGNAVQDFLHPDRVVIGSDDPAALDLVVETYRPVLDQQIPGDAGQRHPVPLVKTSLATAEMSKYASNSFLATKVSFANEIARLCELVGADVTDVMAGIGLDSRIGNHFLDAGVGWGGSCLGKDLTALMTTAAEYGYRARILEAAREVNESQRQHVVDELLRHLKTLRGARICMFGLAFKPETDDVRDSPGLDIAKRLSSRGAFVKAHDPMVQRVPGSGEIRTFADPIAAARGADAVVITTDWPQFLAMDLVHLRQVTRGDVFFDGRNIFNPREVESAGFHYIGIGRPSHTQHTGARDPVEAISDVVSSKRGER